LTIALKKNGQLDADVTSHGRAIFDGTRELKYNTSAARSSPAAFYYKLKQDRSTTMLAYLGQASIMYGYAPATKCRDLADLLNGSQLKTDGGDSPIDGHITRHLVSSTVYGTYEFWIDAACGFMPRRIVISQTANDIGITGEPIGASLPPLPHGAKPPSLPYAPKTRNTITIDAIDLKPTSNSGAFVPMAYRITQTMEFVDNREVTRRSEFSCSDFQFAPNFVALGAFLGDLPDGTPVFNQDLGAVDFEFRHGKVVPKIDAGIMNGIEKEVAMDSPVSSGSRDNATPVISMVKNDAHPRRNWAILGIATLFSLVIVGLYARFRRQCVEPN
jgi:hypothetical protein